MSIGFGATAGCARVDRSSSISGWYGVVEAAGSLEEVIDGCLGGDLAMRFSTQNPEGFLELDLEDVEVGETKLLLLLLLLLERVFFV